MDKDILTGGLIEPYSAQPLIAVTDELVGNTFLGLCPDWVDIVATLKGKWPKFYFDYVGAASPTPANIDKLPNEGVETMEIPARAWTWQIKALADNKLVQDLVCVGMALQGQSLNFLIIANGKIQVMQKELDVLRVQTSKFWKIIEKE